MNRIFILIICCIWYITTLATAQNTPKFTNMEKSPTTEVIEKLLNKSYGDLFNYVVRQEVAQKVWDDVGGYQPLIDIVNDDTAPMKARFLVCEVLSVKQFTYRKDVPKETLAQIYAQALANNYTGHANSWGLLYEHDDEGTTGIMFLELWDKAVPALTPLLDNETQHLYHGSQEATMGNAYRFRVKDFAAYYLSKITKIEVPYYESHEKRDQAIEALKEGLKEYTPD